MNLAEAQNELQRLSRLLDRGLDLLRDNAQEIATAEAEYRKARALAWVQLTEGTAKQKEDTVDSMTADLRYKRDLADHMRQAALEAVRSRRTQLSAIQSLLAAHRAEADLYARGPALTP